MTAVFRSLEAVPAGLGPCVAAIGNFDGVHLGHQEILGAVTEEARARDMQSVAVTFDPHPEQLLRPHKAPGLLTPMEQRIQLLSATGIDAIVVLRFDEALALLSGREFVEQILTRSLGVRSLHEGGNFRFGHKAECGVTELAAFGRELGFTLTVHGAVHERGMEVSSSAIRELVAAGDVRRARWMLGRPFAITGRQKRDRGVGSRLLVPTVNLVPRNGLLPAYGIYVTRLTIGDRSFEAVSSIGVRPTFPDAGYSMETYILDYEPVELNDETPLELEFLLRLRDEKKFDSIEELKAEIMKDVARAQRYFRRAAP